MSKTDKTKSSSRVTLSESDSKRILAGYGIPVVKEVIAHTIEEAVKASRELGFPVVLKGLGSTLLHKTERGIVHLNLVDTASVEQAATLIQEEVGEELEGFLVQPQVKGKREFVAGMFRDRQFGPVILFGLGGVFTEAFSDVSLRLAPIDEIDIEEMLNEVKAKSLLGAFRGEQAADRTQLVKTLLGLSRLSLEQTDIAEIDINPLIVGPNGSISAVDALIIKEDSPAKQDYSIPVTPASIEYFFHPKPIAFIGASGTVGKWGYNLPMNTLSGKFESEVYLVNPRGGTIAGRKVYKSVEEIPGNVDLAVVTIPAAKVLDLIPQLQRKKIKDVLLITSGFGETGVDGKSLEKELVKKAREAGILILGPNTMGICNPHIHLYCMGVHVQPPAGSTAILSQSGNMGVQLLAFAHQQGIGIRGFCGSGNEAMLTIEDFLNAFELDDLTETVVIYMESVKNGRRFFESAKRVSKKKPVILLKGGQSGAGNLAASSHTGAMTSDSKTFDAMCKQTGIIQVNQSLELLDLAASFSSLPLPKGNRVAIMTLGGGWGVVTADLCEYFGLEVPALTPELMERIDKILPPYWSRVNPIDLVGENDPSLPKTVLEELMKWDGCDAIINLGIIGKRVMAEHLFQSMISSDPSYTKEFIEGAREIVAAFEADYIKYVATLMDKYQKPVYGVSIVTDEKDKTVNSVEGCKYKSVFFPTPERAVKSMAKMAEYHHFISRHS
ncbi:acetate--CoA ligase family protein [bacterium]|nr:acetate--CoA ligase family protein [bacterium]